MGLMNGPNRQCCPSSQNVRGRIFFGDDSPSVLYLAPQGFFVGTTEKDGPRGEPQPTFQGNLPLMLRRRLPHSCGRCKGHWGPPAMPNFNRSGPKCIRARCLSAAWPQSRPREVLMRTALSLLKQETSCRQGVKTKRLCAAWDEDYLEKVLLGQ